MLCIILAEIQHWSEDQVGLYDGKLWYLKFQQVFWQIYGNY